MRSRTYSDEQESKVRELFENTEMTLEEIARQTDTSYKIVWGIVARTYTPEARLRRKQTSYRNSRVGEANPSFGRTGKTAFRWIGGRVSDGNGYIMVTKPDWYTGRRGSKYVFEHTLAMCQALGLTELPAGFVVHHIDHNRQNNDLTNLTLLTNAAHARLHALEGVTTISKESRD